MATYYVAQGGSNSNNGTSQSTPWATPPGMGWSRVLAAGDIVKIMSGSNFGNAFWHINASRVGNGTSGNPIIFERESGWGSGNIYFRGCIYINCNGIRIDGKTGNIDVNDQPYNFGITVINDAGPSSGTIDCAMLVNGNYHDIKYISFTAPGASGSPGCSYSLIKPWNVYNSTFSNLFVDNRNAAQSINCFEMDRGNVSNLTFNHCIAARVGPTDQAMFGGANYWIGWHSTDQIGPIIYNHCQSINTSGRAWDIGGYNSQSGTHILNFCQARGGRGSGFGVNGEAGVVSPVPNIHLNYCIARDLTNTADNRAGNGYFFYEVSGNVYMNNCIATRCVRGINGHNNYTTIRNTVVRMRNCAFFQNTYDIATTMVTNTTGYGLYGQYRCDFDYNAFWGSQYFCYWPGAEYGGSAAQMTYAQARPGDPNGWWASNSLLKAGYTCDLHSISAWQTGFKASMINPNANDFHLNLDSSLVDKGTSSVDWD